MQFFTQMIYKITFSIVRYKKAKRSKLLRFESAICFRHEVKMVGEGGLRGNKPNQLGPFEWANLKHWISTDHLPGNLLASSTYPLVNYPRYSTP